MKDKAQDIQCMTCYFRNVDKPTRTCWRLGYGAFSRALSSFCKHFEEDYPKNEFIIVEK